MFDALHLLCVQQDNCSNNNYSSEKIPNSKGK